MKNCAPVLWRAAADFLRAFTGECVLVPLRSQHCIKMERGYFAKHGNFVLETAMLCYYVGARAFLYITGVPCQKATVCVATFQYCIKGNAVPNSIR